MKKAGNETDGIRDTNRSYAEKERENERQKRQRKTNKETHKENKGELILEIHCLGSQCARQQ